MTNSGKDWQTLHSNSGFNCSIVTSFTSIFSIFGRQGQISLVSKESSDAPVTCIDGHFNSFTKSIEINRIDGLGSAIHCPSAQKSLEIFERNAKSIGARTLTLQDASSFLLFRAKAPNVNNPLIKSTLWFALLGKDQTAMEPRSYYTAHGYEAKYEEGYSYNLMKQSQKLALEIDTIHTAQLIRESCGDELPISLLERLELAANHGLLHEYCKREWKIASTDKSAQIDLATLFKILPKIDGFCHLNQQHILSKFI